MADEPPKKKKKTAKEDDEGDSAAKSYEERLKAVGPISQPLADKKHTKKLHKLVKKASGAKALRRGVKEVVKGLRKGLKGVCVIAGDISPIDVISHLPVFCEESAVPYVYVPSKEELGTASCTKRPTSIVLVSCKADSEHKEVPLASSKAPARSATAGRSGLGQRTPPAPGRLCTRRRLRCTGGRGGRVAPRLALAGRFRRVLSAQRLPDRLPALTPRRTTSAKRR